jgi:ketosteroid isomerase-like protein
VLPVDEPAVVAEVTAAFESYENALRTNDAATLTELFWTDPRTIRYGDTGNAYGADAIAAFRAARTPVNSGRSLGRVVITTFGADMAVVSAEFRRSEGAQAGRQTQTWIRTADGWRVVNAHVSFPNVPPGGTETSRV